MPKNEQIYIVEGFAFASESEAEKAQKESEGIKYIKEKINMNHPERVLQIYNKMISEKMFVTVVGYGYLSELQEYLKRNPSVKNEDIFPIEIIHSNADENLKEEKGQKINTKNVGSDGQFEKKYKISLVINLILVISVIGMFAISATSKHPTILNYEEKLINRYSAWEQELTEREAALREAEK